MKKLKRPETQSYSISKSFVLVSFTGSDTFADLTPVLQV